MMTDMYPQRRKYRLLGRFLRDGQDEGALTFALAFQCLRGTRGNLLPRHHPHVARGSFLSGF
jgi:hypothetical protein